MKHYVETEDYFCIGEQKSGKHWHWRTEERKKWCHGLLTDDCVHVQKTGARYEKRKRSKTKNGDPERGGKSKTE